MLQKGYLKERANQIGNHKQSVSKARNLAIYIGALVLTSASIYMVVNYGKADSVVNTWVPFMGAGVWLTFIGLFVFRPKQNRTQKKFQI